MRQVCMRRGALTAQAGRALADRRPAALLHRSSHPRRQAACRWKRGLTMPRSVRMGTDWWMRWTCPRPKLVVQLQRIAQAIMA